MTLVYPILPVNNDGMNPSRLAFLIVAGCTLLYPTPVNAQAAGSPFVPDKQFSADQVMTLKQGTTMTSKVYTDNGKVRTEISTQGMQVVSILRADEKKMYSIMPSQRMVIVMPLDADKISAVTAVTSGENAKVETVGPDAVDGVPCTKYKMTTKDNRVLFWWVNSATKTPVQMAADDGSFTLAWKNYKVGPQDASLFEPPKDYQMMQMPGAPGGATPGGQ